MSYDNVCLPQPSAEPLAQEPSCTHLVSSSALPAHQAIHSFPSSIATNAPLYQWVEQSVTQRKPALRMRDDG
jgi:hypothetical protein